jgi:hypothetical protein
MSEFHTVMMIVGELPVYLQHDNEVGRWYWQPGQENAYRFSTRDEARQALAQLSLNNGDRVTIQRCVTRYAGHITLTVGA